VSISRERKGYQKRTDGVEGIEISLEKRLAGEKETKVETYKKDQTARSPEIHASEEYVCSQVKTLHERMSTTLSSVWGRSENMFPKEIRVYIKKNLRNLRLLLFMVKKLFFFSPTVDSYQTQNILNLAKSAL
jgi:hypothetical protein